MNTRWSQLVLALAVGVPMAMGQSLVDRLTRLPRGRFKSGDETLAVFRPIAQAVRHSVVKLDVDGGTVALAAVIDTNGLAITKASEIKNGKLTCWLAGGHEVPAELLARNVEDDVALIRVQATGLKPIQWALDQPSVGQWAVTSGIEEVPHAVGIVSALPRAIRAKRGLIGVELDLSAEAATLAHITPGFGAEKAGLKAGDVIMAVNQKPIQTGRDLVETLREFRPGQNVQLHVRRSEREFDADIELRPAPSDDRPQGPSRQDRINRLGTGLSQRAEGFESAIQHDTVLPPWLCGGPLVNIEGRGIGLNIARAGRAASYALPVPVLERIIEDLKAQAQTAIKPKGTGPM